MTFLSVSVIINLTFIFNCMRLLISLLYRYPCPYFLFIEDITISLLFLYSLLSLAKFLFLLLIFLYLYFFIIMGLTSSVIQFYYQQLGLRSPSLLSSVKVVLLPLTRVPPLSGFTLHHTQGSHLLPSSTP